MVFVFSGSPDVGRNSPCTNHSAVLNRLISPFFDFSLIGRYCLVILPLALASMLQRLEHVLDNRFIASLGEEALLAHSINYNFFLTAQAVGMAASTSALIFWKREEHRGSQRGIMLLHVGATASVCLAVAAISLPLLGPLVDRFGASAAFRSDTRAYLAIGLANMVLAAVYAPLNALLVASDQRGQSLLNVAILLALKATFGSAALMAVASKACTAGTGLALIGLGGTVAIAAMAVVAWRRLERPPEAEGGFVFEDMRSVWLNELGIAAIRSATPFLYGYCLVRSSGGSAMLITHQLTLHLAYFLTLPQLAGVPIAIRDASEEESRPESSGIRDLLRTSWFRWFFPVSLAPTLALLAVGALFGTEIIRSVFGYAVPEDCRSFPPLFLAACAIGQVGSLHLVTLRALKMNSTAMRNLFIAELGVMVGATALAVAAGMGSPTVIGGVMLAYCSTFAVLNFASVARSNGAPLKDREAI